MKSKLYLLFGLLTAGVMLGITFPATAFAANETYRWENETTIVGSGGEYDSGVISANQPVGSVRFVRDGTTDVFRAQGNLQMIGGGSAVGGTGSMEVDFNRCDLQLAIIVGADTAIGKTRLNNPGDANECERRTLTETIGINNNQVAPDSATFTPEGQAAAAAEEVNSCQIDGIGWILCPVMNLMANVVDGAYAFVSSLLVIQPLLTTADKPESRAIYDAWTVMRTIANVAFVIAFFVIIFSQLTSFGINNYGIKKMLPRLIIAAILVNISFWICAVAVDISNILGASLAELLKGVPVVGGTNNLTINVGEGTAAQTGDGWLGITGLVLAGAVGVGIVLYATLSALLPALVAALFAIVIVFLVLTLRQALIVLLIVVSPLAFVAYLLPNTESLFKKWLGLFQTLLLMYPIIALIFGASALASAVVMQSASGQYTVAIQIMGALIAIIPLALTPVVMKTAGGLLNRFGGVVNNPNKGPFDRLRKGAEGVRDNRQVLAKGRRINRAAEFRSGKKFNGRIGNKLWGDANTPAGAADRAVMSGMFGGAYEANQRDRKRKDMLSAYESDAERIYSQSATGQKYGSESVNKGVDAATAKTDIQTIAEQNQSQISKLASESSKQRLKEAQEGSNVMIAEVKADKLALTGVADELGQALRNSEEETKILSSQAASAGRIEDVAFNERVSSDPSMAARMGGVDPYGAQRANAISVDSLHRVFDGNVGLEKSTMTDMNIDSLKSEMNNINNSEERRSAAAGMVAKNGGMGDILSTIDSLGDNLARATPGSRDAQVIKSMQQQFMADGGAKLPVSMTGPSKGALSTGTYTSTLSQEINASFDQGKYSGEKLASLSGHELKAIANTLTSDTSAYTSEQKMELKNSINTYLTAAKQQGKEPALEIKQHLEKIEGAFNNQNS